MNLKIFTGFLTASMFIMSCGTTNLVQEKTSANKTANVIKQEVLKPPVIDASTVNSDHKANSIKFKITPGAFKTKASASGSNMANLSYVRVNLCHDNIDPIGSGCFFDAADDSAWQKVLVADIDAVIIAEVDGGNTGDGATWYGAMRAYNASDAEIGIINDDLQNTSDNERIAISDDAVYIGKNDYKFYTDNTFTTVDNSANKNELDLTLTIENIGATIGSTLGVNPGDAVSGAIGLSGS